MHNMVQVIKLSNHYMFKREISVSRKFVFGIGVLSL